MSKESYIRGFCKAAEAAGVDPKALAKYAQQYKTDGYAPNMDTSHSEGVNIPYVSGDGYMSKTRTPNMSSFSLVDEIPTNSVEKLRRILNPRHAAWTAAHTNALSKAIAPVQQSGIGDMWKKIPADLKGYLEKIYHDEMKRTTSAPPAQASAPISKK